MNLATVAVTKQAFCRVTILTEVYGKPNNLKNYPEIQQSISHVQNWYSV